MHTGTVVTAVDRRLAVRLVLTEVNILIVAMLPADDSGDGIVLYADAAVVEQTAARRLQNTAVVGQKIRTPKTTTAEVGEGGIAPHASSIVDVQTSTKREI